MVLFLLGRPVTCSLGVKAGVFSWFLQQKVKETSPNQILIYYCYWNVYSVISDNSYDEVFTEDDIFEKCGKRHPVSPNINKILDCAGIEEKGKMYEEQYLDMSNM